MSENLLALPVPPQQRLHNVDTLRGFALLGILLVNLFVFSAPYLFGDVLQLSAWSAWWDKGLELLVWVFAEGAFYSIFSMLFGWGFALQLQRAQARATPLAPRFSRRLLILLIIGLIHIFGIWFGDILTTYAVTGFFLLPFAKCSSRTLLIWIFSLALLWTAFIAFAPDVALSPAESQQNLEKYIAIYQSNWGNIQALRSEKALQSLAGLIFLIPNILWLFLLGMWVQKQQIVQQVAKFRPALRRVLAFTLPLGLVCKGIYLYSLLYQPNYTVRLVFSTVSGGPLLGISYAIMLLLLLSNSRWQQRFMPIAKVGRMALSNYLLQSVVCTLIFYGYGLGLYGTLPPSLSIPLMLLLYGVQVLLSNWWLGHFRYGAMEWLWRRLSYGKIVDRGESG